MEIVMTLSGIAALVASAFVGGASTKPGGALMLFATAFFGISIGWHVYGMLKGGEGAEDQDVLPRA